MVFAKGVFIEEIDGQQTVEGVFLVQSRQVGTTRKGDPFLKVQISDRTGSLEGRVWSNTPAIAVKFDQGDFVHVQARSDVWQGQVQLNVIDVRVLNEDQVDLADYMPATRFDIDSLEAQLRGLIEARVRSSWIRQFLQEVLDDPFIRKRFRVAPAAKFNHHAFIGGLLEHVLSMARLALTIAGHYERYYPAMIDADLLVAGVVLHDLGKITELSYDREFAYTDEGELVGHLVTGVSIVDRVAARLEGFPSDLVLKLQHLVVSHHGKLEYGSPKKPRLIEAILLHEVDLIDSRMNAFSNLLANNARQDEARTGSWSEYSRMFEVRMMLPPVEGYPWAEPGTIGAGDLLGPGLAQQDLVKVEPRDQVHKNGRLEGEVRSITPQLNLLDS